MAEHGSLASDLDGDLQQPLVPLSDVYRVEAAFRSGPLPAPEELARYNEIQPDLVDRIVAMAESDLSARTFAIRRAADAEARAVLIGSHVSWLLPVLLWGTAIAIAATGGSVYLAALVVVIAPVFEGSAKIIEAARRRHNPPS